MFKRDDVLDFVNKGLRYDLYNRTDNDCSDGWKLSIQGKTILDIINVYDLLSPVLYATETNFKLATSKRINHSHPEQSKKVMTIYITNGTDVKVFAESIYNILKSYKGWHDIKPPTSYEHYAGAVYFRNDRNTNGEYIKAN